MNKGKIIRIVSNLYTVNVDGINMDCQARGKFRNQRITPLVGDYCEVDIENKYIMNILPRKNYLLRPSIANVDIALIVTSLKKPDFSPILLDKLITIVTLDQIEPMLLFTKMDLLAKEEIEQWKKVKKYYQKIGYRVFTNLEINDLKKELKEKIVVVTGQTGAGKSTLLNKLNEKLELKTSPISEALNRGVHTTRHTELFEVDDFLIADTPGFSALDLSGFQKEEIRDSFKEFFKYTCKFRDCMHEKEQDCKVKEAVRNEEILQSRYKSYLACVSEVPKWK